MNHWLIAGAAIAALVVTLDARAEEPPAGARRSRAQELFDSGQTALQSGRIAEACDAFAESQRIESALGTLLNLAFCHEHEGRTATAWLEFRAAAEQAGASHQEGRERFAHEHARALEGKLAHLKLVLPRGQSLAQVNIDGRSIEPQLPPDIAVDGGSHVLAARLGDGRVWQEPFTVQDRSTLELVAPEPGSGATAPSPPLPESNEPASSAPPQTPASDDGHGRRVLGLVLGGVGVAGLGVGTYFGLRTLSDKSDAATHCDSNGTNCDAQGHSIGTEAKTFGWISTVAFGVGAVGVAVGAWLFLSARPNRPRAAVHLGPLAGSTGHGVSLDYSW